MRFLTAGETHGRSLVAVLEGFPSGVKLDFARINNELARRQKGHGRGGRMQIEKDEVVFLSGVRGGITTGAPIAMQIDNADYQNWSEGMDVATGARDYKAVYEPRPGHADLAGVLKYNYPDARYVLERASARETAIRTAVGAVARELLHALGITVGSHVICIGGIKTKQRASYAAMTTAADESEVRCLDASVAALMIQAIDLAASAGDTLGGEVEIVASGLKAGIGSHVHYDRKLDFKLMGAVGSIQAVKAVAIGGGFEAGTQLGSAVHDEIFYRENKIVRATNNAGGIEGGISNGESIVVHAVMKPIPTLKRGLKTINIKTKTDAKSANERSDVCAVPALSVVAENVVAYELANAILETLGGDYIEEVIERYQKK